MPGLGLHVLDAEQVQAYLVRVRVGPAAVFGDSIGMPRFSAARRDSGREKLRRLREKGRRAFYVPLAHFLLMLD